MCGIAAIIQLSQSTENDSHQRAIQSMLSEMNHRGPDAQGIEKYSFDNSSIWLGHKRLSIIDLSQSADQPMMSNECDYSIVFNGEIYNYLELKYELQAHYAFKTNSDTEVILAAYIIWGAAMLDKLEGMFAFLVVNTTSGEFFGARDPLGIKPFYYSLSNGSLFVASEPNVIGNVLKDKLKVNIITVADFLMFGLSDHTERTFFKDIMQLQGGHFIMGISGVEKFEIQKYWFPENVHYEKDNIQDHVYAGIENSIRLHIRSDVAVGGCLSGGIDSGSINYIASKLISDDNVRFKSITFTEPGFVDDEREFAAITSIAASTEANYIRTNGTDLQTELDKLVKVMGEPFNSLSMFAQYKVFQKASALGLKVMLDGQGGDEVFAGYPRVAVLIIKEYLRRGEYNNAWRELKGFNKNASLSFLQIIGINFLFSNKNLSIYRNSYRLKGLVDSELLEQYDQSVAFEYFGPKSLYQAQFLELTKYIIPRLLRYEDRNSMSFSIESRVPFLSKSVVNLGLSLNSSFKVKNGWTKFSLRKAMEHKLPDEIVWQTRKRGFDIPQQKWIEEIKPFLIQRMQESRGYNKYLNIDQLIYKIQNGQASEGHIWRIISLQLWLANNDLYLD
jgi:asparagine synthase (glutamine-hydrolysing)